MNNDEDILQFTSLDLPMFSLVEMSTNNLQMTTEKGEEQTKLNSAAPIPTCIFIFMTLFWLCFYPTFDPSPNGLETNNSHAGKNSKR